MKSHRRLLPKFTCTTPVPRGGNKRPLPHPKPWEHDVQSHIRRLKPPVSDEVVVLGTVDDTIVSVAQFLYLTDESIPVVFLRVLAVSTDSRGRGGHVADATLEEVLSRVANDLNGYGHHQALALGRVNHHNTPSQDLLSRHQFTPGGQATADVQEWIKRIAW